MKKVKQKTVNKCGGRRSSGCSLSVTKGGVMEYPYYVDNRKAA